MGKKICRFVKYAALPVLLVLLVLTGCGEDKEQVLIYTSAEDYRIEYLSARLQEEFPQYDIVIEYMSTGNHAARLLAEGASTPCDISYDLEYSYMSQLATAGLFADLSERYDMSIYEDTAKESNYYVVEYRNGGGIILNTEVMASRGLSKPTSYQDLLKPEYQGLISMPNPKASGTGYMFLKSLVNAWGEQAAFDYFDKLTDNILQYTSSGSGPVNALLQGEAAVGLGMVGQAVTEINSGAPLEIVYFAEGSPYCFYGQAMTVSGKDRPCAQAVFDFLINEYCYENNEKFFPEKIYKDRDFTIKNYPQNIVYSDMSGNTIEEKEHLLSLWKY